MTEKTFPNLSEFEKIKPHLTQKGKLRIYDYGHGIYLLTGYHEVSLLDTTPEAHDVASFISWLLSQGLNVSLYQNLEIFPQYEKTAVLIKASLKAQSQD